MHSNLSAQTLNKLYLKLTYVSPLVTSVLSYYCVLALPWLLVYRVCVCVFQLVTSCVCTCVCVCMPVDMCLPIGGLLLMCVCVSVDMCLPIGGLLRVYLCVLCTCVS